MTPTSPLTPSLVKSTTESPPDGNPSQQSASFGSLSVRIALPDSARSSALSMDRIDVRAPAFVPITSRTAAPPSDKEDAAPARAAADSKRQAKDRSSSGYGAAVRALLQGDAPSAVELPRPCSLNEVPAVVRAARQAQHELSLDALDSAVTLQPLLPLLFDTARPAAENRDRLAAALRTLEGWEKRRDMARAFRLHDWQDGAAQSSAVCLQALTELLGPEEAFRACCESADSGPLDILLAGAVDALVGGARRVRSLGPIGAFHGSSSPPWDGPSQ